MRINSKVGKLSDINKYIKKGGFVAIGGGWRRRGGFKQIDRVDKHSRA